MDSFANSMKDMCLTLAVICMIFTVVTCCLCFVALLRIRRKVAYYKRKNLRQAVDRKFATDCASILLKPSQNGRFAQPIKCHKCYHVAEAADDLCVHFKRMILFLKHEESIKVSHDAIFRKENRSPRRSVSDATLDLNEIMKQYPFLDSSCSMLYSACDVSSGVVSSTEGATVGASGRRSLSGSNSRVANFFEPLKKVAKKFSFSNKKIHRSPFSQEERKTSSPNLLFYSTDKRNSQHGNSQILEVTNETSWSPTFGSKFKRWSILSLTSGGKNADASLYANQVDRFSLDSLFTKNEVKGYGRNGAIGKTPKIIVHHSSIKRRTPPSLNKMYSASLQYLTVSECNKSKNNFLPPVRRAKSVLDNDLSAVSSEEFTKCRLAASDLANYRNYSSSLSASLLNVHL